MRANGMEATARHISVTVPSGTMNSPRAAVARQSLQTALNRSIPAQGQGVEDFSKYHTSRGTTTTSNKRASSPRMVRTAPSGATGTNEFIGRTRTGPSRQPAKTSIVDFGGVPLHPRERRNVRGIDGFFPPLRMKSGSGSGKFVISESMSTAWGPRVVAQDQFDSPTSSQLQFNVELAPQHGGDLGPDSVPHTHPSTDWLQRRNNGQANVVLNNSLIQGQGHQAAETPRPSPRVPRRSPPAPEVTGLQQQQQQQRKKDAAWVRAFKVKQSRNNRYKEMDLGSGSMSNMEDGNKKWGLSD